MRAFDTMEVLILIAVALVACRRGKEGRRSGPVRVAPGVVYSLEDGERSHREAPETFEIPSLAEREALAPGRIVKLMFRITADGETLVERMWVIVEGEEAGGYVGSLDNQPYSTEAMRPGLKLHFHARHVISIYDDRAEDGPSG